MEVGSSDDVVPSPNTATEPDHPWHLSGADLYPLVAPADQR